ALDPADVAGADDLQAVWLAGLPDQVPDPHRVPAGIAHVDLVAELSGVAGAGDDHIQAIEGELVQVVVADVQHGVPEQVPHDRGRVRALHLDGGDVGLADLHIEAGPIGDTPGPEQDVAVCQGEPEVVLPQPQQHRVVEDPTGLVGEEDVLALAHLTLRQVPGDEQVGEVEGVRTGDLDLPFDTDVPQGDAVQQRP